MTDDQQRPNSSLAAWLSLAVLLIVTLYVPSVGPVVRLHDRGYVGEWVGVFYVPLEYAHNHYEPIQRPLDWYVALWRTEPQPMAVPSSR